MNKQVSLGEILNMEDAIVKATGFTHGQLSDAFDKLTVGMENWKMPIEATIRESDFDLMNEACAWFTGSRLSALKLSNSGDLIQVSAAGYYMTIGA